MEGGLAGLLGKALEQKLSRRGFVGRAAVAGAAFTVDPLGILRRPGGGGKTPRCWFSNGCSGSRWGCAKITDPSTPCWGFRNDCRDDCRGGCGDGWTSFCCAIPGGSNKDCPDGTFVGGWWSVNSSPLCEGHTRYLIDCNAICHNDCTHCAGTGWCGGHSCGSNCGAGCYHCIDFDAGCPNHDCSNRATSRNWFRYGNCNDGRSCSGPVVCRLHRCHPPWHEWGACDRTGPADPPTKCHTQDCLDIRDCGSEACLGSC